MAADDETRITEAVDLLVQGATCEQVVRYGLDHWGWSDTADAAPVVSAAADRLAHLAYMDPDVRTGLVLAMLQDIYRRAAAVNDLAAMIRAAQALAKLPLATPPDNEP